VVSGGELRLFFNSSTDKQGLFTVYDMSGRAVFSTTVLSATQSQSIALPNLAAGIYNCVIKHASRCYYKKLVVEQGW